MSRPVWKIVTMYRSGLFELEAVVAIAKLGGFRAAAIDLDVSPTAVGNAVANLEKRLGVRLFNRTTRTVALTSAGRAYVEVIAPALSEIRNASRAVADHGEKPSGTLRFSCSLAGGRQLLQPFVFEYLRRHDKMKVEIVTEGRLIDIIKEGFDAGVRLAEAVPQDMIAMPLGPQARHVVVGAPSYFANRPKPKKPADLMNHECIRVRHSSGVLYRWELERRGEAMKVDVPGSLTLGEPEMMAQASRAGIGLAYVGQWLVAEDIASGRLIEVLSDWTPSYPGFCLYYPGPRHMAASLRTFVNLARDVAVRGRKIAS
jgi:DNA-binding transcriptional LysR family regulator